MLGGECSSFPIYAGAGSIGRHRILFFLPPSLLRSLESRPIEEVLFLRDEMANLAWGLNDWSKAPPSSRSTGLKPPGTETPARARDGLHRFRPPSGALRYRLTTEIPDYWIPLMPVQIEEGLRLKRGAVLKTDGSQAVVHGLGRILNP